MGEAWPQRYVLVGNSLGWSAALAIIPTLLLLYLLGVKRKPSWIAALSGLGALIGVLAPNQQVAGVITNLALVVVMFLSPVLAPASALPGVLQLTARLLPPTYAADALRQTLAGQVNAGVGLDLAVLLAFTVGSLYLVSAKLDWRLR